MITLIDYGVGNINAFVNVYKRVDVPVKIAKTKEDLLDAQKLILPGVGHFDHAMSQLNNSGMRETLDELVLDKKIPVIGICVGMQMMANNSDEGKMDGLKWIDATVKKFDEAKIKQVTRLPHMGWNDVKPIKDLDLFKGLEKDAIFYFLHTYYFDCNNREDIMAITDYGGEFASAAHHENKYGIQFHPEKSHSYGEILLHNFAKL
ncbi:imidazole glycerol phosphate synthase, glutamine amidotransferase subunit [Elizabethkingia meningoseptica]|uniref:Imidazole glycerol phosphate synthase subunit HisH n=1 Tax=Elizabethkingia meningoseptica TaxID=238 RepID=A0A1T3FHE5_ELIME|nr:MULTISPECIES: imidazole glycerol phosphate synthase subunit HisH [Elizabethkingia]AQX12441.1 imidazole glycerol phosphate synthase, glutamine amidotransferase subunit [Elizabethkingia meningoseptica]MBG0513980.1 imidazole glycerol phosphate synthase subunit HisH [Elizabethkingia meningoseptica]MDE5432895.1 imidazole glycerol phosphate synthase subunit HisH [Elizabethkingia meningoseptica]MDE5448035.1 imidazole glycerol phosphate synthase subunit HisH [Elizabethkingia meningoseptica]MDE54716